MSSVSLARKARTTELLARGLRAGSCETRARLVRPCETGTMPQGRRGHADELATAPMIDEMRGALSWTSLQPEDAASCTGHASIVSTSLQGMSLGNARCGSVVVRRALRLQETIEPGKRDLSGCMVWPTAVLASRLLEERPVLVHGARVVELGAGVGLLGITAALCCASRVVVTDGGAAQTLELLRQNTLRAAKKHKLRNLECHPTAIRWGAGQCEDAACTAGLLHRYGAFDVVLASDVLYPGSQPTAFFAMARELLGGEGVLLLALAARPALPPGWRFVQEVFAAAAGASLQCMPDLTPVVQKKAGSVRAVLFFQRGDDCAGDRCKLDTTRQGNQTAFERIYNQCI